MTDKYKDLRDALEKTELYFSGEIVVIKSRLVRTLLAERDAKHAALELVRMSAGWQHMSDETRQVVIAALTQGESDAKG